MINKPKTFKTIVLPNKLKLFSTKLKLVFIYWKSHLLDVKGMVLCAVKICIYKNILYEIF